MESHAPQLLLTPQRIKRLKRDQERQTPRWLNFEERVMNVRDSPERGFELALYYAVTGDKERAREAVTWAKEHLSDCRQTALVLAWCRDALSVEEKKALSTCNFSKNGSLSNFRAERDKLFIGIANGSVPDSSEPSHGSSQINQLVQESYKDSNELYAAVEVISVSRANQHVDLRENAPRFFKSLPVQFLLDLKPDQTEHPDWMTHVAALALVSLDPNSDSSQFLQGWAIEDRQMIREGPGVAYELLWADPYLPGVGYQNLDPWFYDEEQNLLLARNNWQGDACWIRISSKGVEQQNCPTSWQSQPFAFGHLQLIPFTQNCVELGRSGPNGTTIFWKLKPGAKIKYSEGGKSNTATASASGLLRVPANVEGKVCAAR